MASKGGGFQRQGRRKVDLDGTREIRGIREYLLLDMLETCLGGKRHCWKRRGERTVGSASERRGRPVSHQKG
eukprot:scaffold38652_cov23-Tisochrysis_lutea.AAC.3